MAVMVRSVMTPKLSRVARIAWNEDAGEVHTVATSQCRRTCIVGLDRNTTHEVKMNLVCKR